MKNDYNFYRQQLKYDINPNQTIYNLVKEQNVDRGKSAAINYFGTDTSYDKLYSNADKLADAYYKLGIREGDSIGLLLINVPAVQENILALSKLGAKAVWIDVRNKEKDLINKLNENNCKYVVAFDEIVNDVSAVINETNVKKVFSVSPKDYLNPFVKVYADYQDYKEGKKVTVNYSDKVGRFIDLRNSGSSNSIVTPVVFEKDRPSIIVQSSGSTGKAKSILHTEYNFNSEMVKESHSDLPLQPGKRMHISVPPFIIYGLCNSTYAAMVFGMTGVMTPYVRAEAIYDDLGKFDFACGAPFHYRYIYDKIVSLKAEIDNLMTINSKDAAKELKIKIKEYTDLLDKLDKVSAFISGGDKFGSMELLKMEQEFGTPIINGYGNNEMCGAAVVTPVFGAKPDSAGVPLYGIEVHAFDDVTNEQLPDGEIGELCMHSDNMFVEYINNSEETNKVKKIHKDGKEWIHTGDLGYIDDDGFVYITGRTRRLIKMDGFKISPETIESAVLSLDCVKDCVVVGAPDAVHVEVPMIFLEKNGDLNLSDDEFVEIIKQQCKENVPDYENPSYYEVVESIPHNNGKHDFNLLEAKAKQYVEKHLEKSLKKTS